MRQGAREKGVGAVWLVIHIAQDQSDGERVCELLRREGILATWRPVGAGGEGRVEVLVPAGEAPEAHQILMDALRR